MNVDQVPSSVNGKRCLCFRSVRAAVTVGPGARYDDPTTWDYPAIADWAERETLLFERFWWYFIGVLFMFGDFENVKLPLGRGWFLFLAMLRYHCPVGRWR